MTKTATKGRAIVTTEITDEFFDKLRKLFKRTSPHASLTALFQGDEAARAIMTHEAVDYWLSTFEHTRKVPELKGATKIQAYAAFTLLEAIRRRLEANGHYNTPIDEMDNSTRQQRAINVVQYFFVNEAEVTSWCRPRLEKTRPRDMYAIFLEEVRRRNMAENDFLLQQVLLEVVKQTGVERSINPDTVIEDAVANVTADAWEGLTRRPNWSGNGRLLEVRTATCFPEIREILEMPVFQSVGNI